jgi:hypothetical protein
LTPQNGGLIKGHFGWSQTSEARNFARLQGMRIVFFNSKFEKNIISRLKVEKKFCKGEKPIPVGFFRKAIVLNRIYTEIVVK